MIILKADDVEDDVRRIPYDHVHHPLKLMSTTRIPVLHVHGAESSVIPMKVRETIRSLDNRAPSPTSL